jgi:hypothetical protein
MILLNAYLRGNDVIVEPTSGYGGVFQSVPPVLIVPPSAEALQSALMEAKTRAGEGGGGAKSKRWFVLDRLGLKSLKAFYVDVAFCSALPNEQGRWIVMAQQPAPDGKGFEPDGTELTVDTAALGQTMLDILMRSPRFPK